MLEKLCIKNIALIDYVEIDFVKSLNILSGETGAGKSIILDALNFVLGAKADKSLIRSGENECVVSAVFDVANNQSIMQVFDSLEIEKEDKIIITRKFDIDGKSSLKLNGENVTIGMLKQFSSILVDLHGQSDHFSLLKNKNQLNLIDSFGGDKITLIKNQINPILSKYKDIVSSLKSLGGDENNRAIKLDILNYQIKEIEQFDLKENEEDELLIIRDKLKNQEKIIEALSSLNNSYNDEGGAGDILGNCLKQLESISNISSEYNDLYQRLYNSINEIADISNSCSNILDSFDYPEYDLNYVEERLDGIKNLKKKYGDCFDEIISFYEKAKQDRDFLLNFENNAKNLLIEKEKYQNELYDLFFDLSNSRKESAKLFIEKVSNELIDLAMEKSTFDISFNQFPEKVDCDFSSCGVDEVDFMFSANAGEPLKKLSQIISGGEISRFMLAVKSQSAKFNDVSTFIFDEIDSGISGFTASVVAKKFFLISKNAQIIAITHLPQISSMADKNILITKIEENGKTVSKVNSLDYDGKVNEIVRLTGGLSSISAINHAKEMINEAENYKKSI